jgi:hypothetical protein
MKLADTLAALCGLLAILAVSAHDVHACACCTNEGQRRVGVETLDAGKREEIGRLRFSADAQLFSGEGDPADIKGIAKSSGRYALHVAQEPNRWVFDFRDKAGGSGTLALVLPATISIFEVDPRLGEIKGGQGPTLYKEWKLTAKATGTGVFAPGVGGSQLISLILQGHGNSCTSSSDFTHWSIVVSGPKAQYTLFGDLQQ